MTKINDGGPAFPLTEDAVNFRCRDFPMWGMSKRELIAGMAMQGILAANPVVPGEWSENCQEAFRAVASVSVKYADALLVALGSAAQDAAKP